LRMLYLSFYSSRFLVLSWTCAYVTWILCAWGCQLCVYLCMQCLSFYSLRFFVVFIWVCVMMFLHVAVRCFCVQVLNLRMLQFNLKNVDLFHGVKSSLHFQAEVTSVTWVIHVCLKLSYLVRRHV
jgi:hypothetical protein